MTWLVALLTRSLGPIALPAFLRPTLVLYWFVHGKSPTQKIAHRDPVRFETPRCHVVPANAHTLIA
jgi:hypothetical protein